MALFRLTRRPRQVLLGAIALGLLAVVISGVMVRRSSSQSLLLQAGWPVMAQEEVTRYTLGWTHWLIVEEQFGDAPLGVVRGPLLNRRLSIHAPGLMEALLLIAAAAALCYWAWRRLVHRLSLDGYCDTCGYDLRQLDSDRCPECGEARPAVATEPDQAGAPA